MMSGYFCIFRLKYYIRHETGGIIVLSIFVYSIHKKVFSSVFITSPSGVQLINIVKTLNTQANFLIYIHF